MTVALPPLRGVGWRGSDRCRWRQMGVRPYPPAPPLGAGGSRGVQAAALARARRLGGSCPPAPRPPPQPSRPMTVGLHPPRCDHPSDGPCAACFDALERSSRANSAPPFGHQTFVWCPPPRPSAGAGHPLIPHGHRAPGSWLRAASPPPAAGGASGLRGAGAQGGRPALPWPAGVAGARGGWGWVAAPRGRGERCAWVPSTPWTGAVPEPCDAPAQVGLVILRAGVPPSPLAVAREGHAPSPHLGGTTRSRVLAGASAPRLRVWPPGGS